MTYQEFVENVKEKLAVREELKNVTLSVESRMKNNGFERTGIIFAEKGKEASPLFLHGRIIPKICEWRMLRCYY